MTRIIAVIALALCLGLANAGCPHTSATNPTRFSSLTIAAGADIVVPAGATYLYDLNSSTVMGNIDVFGTLIFDDTKTLTLRATRITAISGGSIIAGSSACPFQNKLYIFMHGTTASDVHGTGTKSIGVTDGSSLQIVGDVRTPSWTKLAATAPIGATTITLREPVNWVPGDIIVIASTDYETERQNEERRIVSVSADKLTLTLNASLVYNHFAQTYRGMDMRAEVALLTRNIVFSGDATSDSNGFGAHFMFLKAARIELRGVEITKAGQFKHLGRYPIHFHLGGDMAGRAFATDNSIHNCFQRCFTVHATNGIQVWRNVGYKTRGHCFFIEDGVEQDNVFAWNLAINPRRINSADFLPGTKFDDRPTAFWITNPGNTWIGNHAVGGTFGFWFAVGIWPTGFFKDNKTVVIRRIPVKKFLANSAHGARQDGLHFDNGMRTIAAGMPDGSVGLDSYAIPGGDNVGQNYQPQSDARVIAATNATLRAQKTAVFPLMESFSAWRCSNRGVWLRPVSIHFVDYKSADNAIGFTSATSTGQVECRQCLFIGISPNTGGTATPSYPNSNNATFPVRGYEFYDGPNACLNCKFFDFLQPTPRWTGAIGLLREDRFTLSSTNNLRHTFVDPASNKLIFDSNLHDGDREIHIHDYDGFLAGRPVGANPAANHPVLVNDEPYFRIAGCDTNPLWSAYICPNSFTRYTITPGAPYTPPSAAELATFSSQGGGVYVLTRGDTGASTKLCGAGDNDCQAIAPSTMFRGLMPTGHETFVTWAITAPLSVTIELRDLEPDDWVIVAFCYPTSASVVSVGYSGRALNASVPAASSWSVMANARYERNGANLWFRDSSTGWVYLKLWSYSANSPNGYGKYQFLTNVAGGVKPTCTIPLRTSYKRTLAEGSEIEATFGPLRPMPPVAPVPPPPAWEPEPSVPSFDGTGFIVPPPPTPVVATPVVAATRHTWTFPLVAASGVTSTATGSATVYYTPSTRLLEWDITHTIVNPSAAHIHNGSTVSVNFNAWVSPIRGSTTLTLAAEAQVCSGVAYVNVHSQANGGGELQAVLRINCQTGAYLGAPLVVPSPPPPPTPVNCQVSQWSAWGTCDRSCGGGLQTRTRNITVAATNGGTACPNVTMTQACNTQGCAVNCSVGQWGAWANCDVSCGGGTQSRSRPIVTPSANGGEPCPNTTMSQPCNTAACVNLTVVDCIVSNWSSWSTCTASCGGGSQDRTRTVTTPAANNGTACPSLSETQPCNNQTCAVNCTVSAWSAFGQCSAPCNGGVYTRTRSIVTGAANGGSCPSLIDTGNCNTQPCPPDPVPLPPTPTAPNPGPQPGPAPAPEPEPVDASIIGCIVEDLTTPNLTVYSFTDVGMSRLYCSTNCTLVKSWYYGLQGDTCFCFKGKNFGIHGFALPSECNIPCSGNPVENCGGQSRNMIYSITKPDGLDDCIDGGICPTPGASPQPPNIPPPPPPPGPVTPTTGGPVQPEPEPEPEPVKQSGWNGFGGLGLIISIVIIVVIVLVVAAIIGVVIWLVMKKKKNGKKDFSKWEMY